MFTISNTSLMNQDKYQSLVEEVFTTFISKLWLHMGIKRGYLLKYVRLIDYVRTRWRKKNRPDKLS